MKEEMEPTRISNLECCPELLQRPTCDILRFRYRLPFLPLLKKENKRIPVDVILHFELVRCTGPESLVIGDPIYSITLLPGERVKIFTSDRHSQWSYDSETSLSYRHQTTSEESYFTAGMAEAMSDLSINESSSSRSSYGESWAEGGGGASVSILWGLFEAGGGASGGSYDAESATRFSHSLSKHAESASRYVAVSVRARTATSIGEVEQRQHAEGESETSYESASRIFSNPNKCRAITYLFHKINKVQKIEFRLAAIERRVFDPKVPTGVYQRVPTDTTGKLTIKPELISAASKDRLEMERIARTSAGEHQQQVANAKFKLLDFDIGTPTYDKEIRKAALEAVDDDLIDAGILDRSTNEVSSTFSRELSWEREEILPTPGIVVKGCLDECSTCEPGLLKEIELSLEHKQLENDLLKRQIELLEQSQEYRCCPPEPITPDENIE